MEQRIKELVLKVMEWIMIIGLQSVLPLLAVMFGMFFIVCLVYGIKFIVGV